MADIVLKTFRGGSVTPQDDAIIHQTVIATNGIFKGCQVTYSRGNVLHLSQGFGMIKGRFFEVYDTEIPVQLNSTSEKLQGRVYIHLDLSNGDEPIQILTETAPVLGSLTGDEDINYNNTTYDMELATFSVTNTALLDLLQTSSKITGASSGGGASSLQRLTQYNVGDFATCGSTPGWVTLYCTKAGETAAKEPAEYANIAEVGDVVQDGTCMFTARDAIGELDILKDLYTEMAADVTELQEELMDQIDNLPPPVGTIKYSASTDLGEEWLRCDGSFVSASDYPELVAALGKNVPNGEQFKLLSNGEIPVQISNGVVYAGKLWVYSYSERKLYGVDTVGEEPIQIVSLTSTSTSFSDFLPPSTARPIALSIVPHVLGTGAKLFLAQIIGEGTDSSIPEEFSWCGKFLIFSAEFTGNETSLEMEPPFRTIEKLTGTMSSKTYYYYPSFDAAKCVPYVVSKIASGVETYYCAIGERYYSYGSSGDGSLKWTEESTVADLIYSGVSEDTTVFKNQRITYSSKNQGEIVAITTSSSSRNYTIHSAPDGTFETPSRSYSSKSIIARTLVGPLNIVGEDRVIATFDKMNIPYAAVSETKIDNVIPNVTLPSAAKVFVDAGAYLWSKRIYLIFVGTGILFSTDLSASGFGYLDTTSVMGTIVQYGAMTYAEDESELYLMGQDTSNRIIVSKITLNRLFDYANDGAWLPMLVSDGVPAYIKAKTA